MDPLAFVREHMFELVGGAAAVIALGYALSSGKKGPTKPKKLPGIDRLLKEGRYVQAGDLALRHDRPQEAIDYYLRAQEPMRAAQVAAKGGAFKQAAELCERAGEWERAARYYEQAGMRQRGSEIRRERGLTQNDRASISIPAPASGATADERFRKAKTSSGSSTVDKARVQALGRDAAEEALAKGDIKGAAELFREAELHEEAIHLYVNVLGRSEEAAAILSSLGHHDRAADLFEAAGNRERAAATWAKIAVSSDKPEQHLDRIFELHEPTGIGLLDELTRARPLDEGSAELHYRHALALEKKGDSEKALLILEAIDEEIGDYKDVATRIPALEATVAAQEARGSKPPGRSSKAPGRGRTSGPPQGENGDEEDISGGSFSRRSWAPGSRRSRPIRVSQPIEATGLEVEPVAVDRLFDSAVHAAKSGPSVSALKKHLAGAPCAPNNVALYYHLALAQLAAGQFGEALDLFQQVANVAPQYRDAMERIELINSWKNALAPNAHLNFPAGLFGLRVVLGTPEAGGPPAKLTMPTVGSIPPPAPSQPPDQAGTALPTGAKPNPNNDKPPEQRPSTMPQQTESRYAIAGELGRGGMAVVYRATDTVLGRDIALKYLTEQFSEDQKILEMFQREARAVAQLNHPNIVTIYDFGVLGGRTYLAMEYVEGITVRQYLQDKKQLSVKTSLKIILQLLSALELAHSRHIVHRDIKPSNMMRTPTGRIKLMDFGLAKAIDPGEKASMVAGTPGYMPPEQLHGEDIDHRADIFAVGVSLYEMLTGKQPFKGFDRSRAPKPVSSLAPAVPPLLERVLHKSIHLDRSRRVQSAASFAAALQKILEASERHGHEIRPTEAAPPPRLGATT